MVRAAFCRPLSINNPHTPHGAKRPRLSLWESWQPERLTEAPAGAMQASNRRRRLLASRREGVVRIFAVRPLSLAPLILEKKL